MKKNDILLLIISASLIVFAWVGFTIYHSSTSSTVTPTIGQQILPIPASFNTQAIDKLKKRIPVNVDLSSLNSQASPAALVTPQPTPIIPIPATDSAKAASEGGTITP